MRTSSLLVLLACTPAPPERMKPFEPIVGLVPAGRTTALVQRIDDAASASPEALRQYQHSTAPIESRRALSDGFAATLGGEVHVLRERRNRWFDCHAPIADDATRDEVIAACRAFKLP